MIRSTTLMLVALVAVSRADTGDADALPPRLAQTGLYDSDGTLADDLLAFSPQYPLWTDGATKQRWIHLPEGTAIDASDPDRWEFPVGTKLWKQFSFGRKVETRYMELTEDGWRYGTYLWDEAGAEAVLAPDGGTVRVAEGQLHDVPSTADCVVCHDDGAPPVLGFSALQLSPDRDPNAPHAEPARGVDLVDLVATGRLVGLPFALIEDPPRIPGDPVERAARGYLHGNCGGCHDDSSPLASLGMDLRFAVGAVEDDDLVRTTVGRSGRAALPGDPTAPRVRIVPGEPDASVLLGRVRSRDPVHQMPPLGTRVVDEDAVRALARWITQLEYPEHTRRTP